MRAEQKRGVAEPPSEEAKKTDLIENQAGQAIQRTQMETTTTPSGAPAVR
jgi:hypothetical protein